MTSGQQVPLSREYGALYEQMLERVGRAINIKHVKIGAFWPMRGHLYDGKLMVVGKATNGWGKPGWTRDGMLDPELRRRIVEVARAGSEQDRKCPMSWVVESWDSGKEYKPHKSAFWQIALRVACGLQRWAKPDAGWTSYLCWSNLSKLAPAKGGNPSSSLWNAQFQVACQLLDREVKEFAPKVVLVMSGWKWWFKDYAEELGFPTPKPERSELIDAVFHKDGRIWIIAKHPERKRGGFERFAREVLERIGSA